MTLRGSRDGLLGGSTVPALDPWLCQLPMLRKARALLKSVMSQEYDWSPM